MEPLSATASIAGLITAVGKIYGLLDFISSVRNSPTVIRNAKDEVKNAQSALYSLDRYLNSLASLNPKRTAMIQIDDLRVTLTDAMMAFSEFETLLLTLDKIARVKAVIAWPKYAKEIEEHMAKVQRYKTSLTLMLNILQCETQLEASQSQERLHVLIESVMQENKTLKQMMNESQHSFDAQSTFTKRQEDDRSIRDNDEDDTETIRGSVGVHTRDSIGGGSQKDNSKKGHQSRMLRLPFERILEQSWVYRRNQRNSCDRSFISSAERSHTWSVFSGFSLADVSILSVIAMPLTTMDLANGKHYQVEILNEDLTESSSEMGDEETPVRAHTPLSNLDGLSERDKMTNDEPEGDAKDYDDELCICTGCQGPLEKGEAFRLGHFHWHGDCFRCRRWDYYLQ
ncbi:hypothetical protein N0V84_002804 [Fusarium piperis]|uniref:Fungal N-terminal domain-containing protein n=1 Tax=Fusarium piperis TaxID=1435070 RepID=A0A9W8WJA1_9HYPO|nr:hypothetical protein N0V84_002804 [Fusarium piperis]